MQAEAIVYGLQYIEELEFANMAVYKGCMLDGMRHGPGTQIWPNEVIYEGEWKQNKRDG